MVEATTILIMVLGAIMLICVSPFLSFILGWVIGWLIKVVFGATFVTGLKLIGLDIPIESIPLLCGILNVIGSFFRSKDFSSSNKKKDLAK